MLYAVARWEARGSASAAEAKLTFSAVFGTLSALSSKTMRPFSEEPIETSKKTRGLSDMVGRKVFWMVEHSAQVEFYSAGSQRAGGGGGWF